MDCPPTRAVSPSSLHRASCTAPAIYRLLQSIPTKLKGKDKEQENKAEAFTYDAVGNRLTGPGRHDDYSYDDGNQLISDRKHQYEYDHNGNLVKKTERDDDGNEKTWTYAYDYENRLIKVIKQEKDEAKSVTFKYDPFGRRIEKSVEELKDGKSETKIYTHIYDHEDVILEYLTKMDEDGEIKVEVTRYFHGPGIDEPLSIERKGHLYYYHADGSGSIIALSDERQRVVESYDYDSFGNMKRNGDKVKNAYTYTGREWDEETWLYYYRARYYDPKVGRFISKDSIGFSGGDMNLYSYAGNNPINFVDPWGLWTYATEYGTTGTGLTTNITGIENTVDSVFNSIANRDAIVTFTINGTHGANSLHYSGNAIDLRTRDLTAAQIQQAVQNLRNSLGSNYQVINEGDHIHIEYDPSCR